MIPVAGRARKVIAWGGVVNNGDPQTFAEVLDSSESLFLRPSGPSEAPRLSLRATHRAEALQQQRVIGPPTGKRAHRGRVP